MKKRKVLWFRRSWALTLLAGTFLMGVGGCQCGNASGSSNNKTQKPRSSSQDPPKTPVDLDKGQTFIVSLNALAGKLDSDTGVEWFDKSTVTSGDPKLSSTIKDNLTKYEPGGVYISIDNMKTLDETLYSILGSSPNTARILRKKLKELIEQLKDEKYISIEPFIIIQEGYQFQRLLTAKVDRYGDDRHSWRESNLGIHLDIKNLPLVHLPFPGSEANAPNGTYYTYIPLASQKLDKTTLEGKFDDLYNSLGSRGFTLNYSPNGTVLSGPSNTPFKPHRLDKNDYSNTYRSFVLTFPVLAYVASDQVARQIIESYLNVSEANALKMVRFIGGFPGQSFAENTEKAFGKTPISTAPFTVKEMEWNELGSSDGLKYFKDEAGQTAPGDSPKAQNRLYPYAVAIENNVEIIGLTQSKLYKNFPGEAYAYNSKELIDVLRNTLKFGEGVVMVGERSELIRDNHPNWTYKKGGKDVYYGLAEEMSRVTQFDSAMVTRSLAAGVDLFHLWRLKKELHKYDSTRPQDYSVTPPTSGESALDTIDKVLKDPASQENLDTARGRITELKKARGYRGA